jgi:hypothetical protein
MFHYYKLFLLAGMFAVSYGVVSWRNKFDKHAVTTVRIILSILAVWAYVLLSRFVVVEADLALATNQDEIRAIVNGDGAKNAFALLFGWVPGVLVTLIVLTATGVGRWMRYRITPKVGDSA